MSRKLSLWIKPREAADLLGVSLKTVYRMRDAVCRAEMRSGGDAGKNALGGGRSRLNKSILVVGVRRFLTSDEMGEGNELASKN